MNTTIQQQTLAFISTKENVSFAELESFFRNNNFNYYGFETYSDSNCKTIIFWDNWNTEAINLIRGLVESAEITLVSVLVSRYFIDGKVIGVHPMAHPFTEMPPKTNTWFPVVLVANKKKS